MVLELKELPITGALLLTNSVFTDLRGSFEVSWEKHDPFFQEFEFTPESVQHSYNEKSGTLRGMHFQCAPHGQKKLVFCVSGAIWDVIVDLRPDSPSFKSWVSVELSAKSGMCVYIPEGCAHGFITLKDNSTLVYLNENPYIPEAGSVLRWDDETIGIEWPMEVITMSEADKSAPTFDSVRLRVDQL